MEFLNERRLRRLRTLASGEFDSFGESVWLEPGRH